MAHPPRPIKATTKLWLLVQLSVLPLTSTSMCVLPHDAPHTVSEPLSLPDCLLPRCTCCYVLTATLLCRLWLSGARTNCLPFTAS